MGKVHGGKKKKGVILKNSSNNVSHSINKIKEHERRYTIVLVSFFFLLFCVIGYSTLRVHSDMAIGDIHQSLFGQNEILTFGESVTLTKDNIQTDADGLQSRGFIFSVDNYYNQNIHYRIFLVFDDSVIEDCGCKERLISPEFIRYSIDGFSVKSFDSSDKLLLSEGNLEKNSSKNMNIKMWLNENFDKNSDSHLHGYFVVEKVNS